jgi:deazaflavin-dependent oxidoreductase (nitroreductase family)
MDCLEVANDSGPAGRPSGTAQERFARGGVTLVAVAWFADGEEAWQIVASGGRRHPDWYLNLMAHPERTSIELPGRDAVPVTEQRLDGADRAQAWQRITAAQPRYAKYQRKSDWEYPIVRLTLR